MACLGLVSVGQWVQWTPLAMPMCRGGLKKIIKKGEDIPVQNSFNKNICLKNPVAQTSGGATFFLLW